MAADEHENYRKYEVLSETQQRQQNEVSLWYVCVCVMWTDEYVCVSLKSEQQYDLSPNFLRSSIIPILFLFQINGGEKRPASDMGKKPKTPKKKKKKDPNEPQKPVSAYALFFRDTQAAIKGQNPNATFGEVSKIVASMWDGLGEEQKQVRGNMEWESPRLEKVYAPPKKWLLRALGEFFGC